MLNPLKCHGQYLYQYIWTPLVYRLLAGINVAQTFGEKTIFFPSRGKCYLNNSFDPSSDSGLITSTAPRAECSCCLITKELQQSPAEQSFAAAKPPRTGLMQDTKDSIDWGIVLYTMRPDSSLQQLPAAAIPSVSSIVPRSGYRYKRKPSIHCVYLQQSNCMKLTEFFIIFFNNNKS